MFCGGQLNSHELELIEPNENSEIFPLLKRYANNPYHVCYEVDDIDKAVSDCVNKGFLLFKERMCAEAISKDALVVFLMHAKVGIIELVQDKKEV